VWDVVPSIRRLVAGAQPVDLDRLADPDVPLDELQPGRGTVGGAA
jgi:hypothetical protein